MAAIGNLTRRDAARRLHVKTIIESCLDTSVGQMVLKLNNGETCGRIRLLGLVVDKRFKNNFQKNTELDYNSEEQPDGFYASITLDDSTGVINVRAWNNQAVLLNKYNLGDMVEIIGKPREYNGRIYILYECGFIVEDIHWWLLHELKILLDELSGSDDACNSSEYTSGNINKYIINKFIENELDTSQGQLGLCEKSLADKLIDVIHKLDRGDGVLFTTIREELKEFKTVEIEDVLKQLLKEGTLYECKPQRYRRSY